ncbi:hypothetical protein [Amycolatopsis coloradensis]|nr:hypothetical protein [Amycolatopsis coloradensis]
MRVISGVHMLCVLFFKIGSPAGPCSPVLLISLNARSGVRHGVRTDPNGVATLAGPGVEVTSNDVVWSRD